MLHFRIEADFSANAIIGRRSSHATSNKDTALSFTNIIPYWARMKFALHIRECSPYQAKDTKYFGVDGSPPCSHLSDEEYRLFGGILDRPTFFSLCEQSIIFSRTPIQLSHLFHPSIRQSLPKRRYELLTSDRRHLRPAQSASRSGHEGMFGGWEDEEQRVKVLSKTLPHRRTHRQHLRYTRSSRSRRLYCCLCVHRVHRP